MNKEDLFQALGDINPEYIEESEKVRHFPWKKCVAAASFAAMVVICFGAFHVWSSQTPNRSVPVPAKNLAKIEKLELHSEGGFYETCESADLQNELEYCDNLLRENPKKLYPVYAGFGSYDDIMRDKAGKKISESRLRKLADVFATKGNTKIVKRIQKDKTFQSFTCENGMLIQVSYNEDVYLEMKGRLAQPAVSPIPDLYQRSSLFYEYYFEQYKNFFDFNKAKFSPGAIDPNANTPKEIVAMDFHDATVKIDCGKYYDVSITPGYDNIGDSISFTCIDYGKCLGQYPVISQSEAEKKLIDGEGITFEKLFANVTRDRIAAVTLTYMGTTPQPVYTFYLKLTDAEKKKAFEDDEEMPKDEVYIKYYIPAVEAKYFK